MNFFARFLRRRESNPVTVRERQRLASTMPGQTAAVAANRLGAIIY